LKEKKYYKDNTAKILNIWIEALKSS